VSDSALPFALFGFQDHVFRFVHGRLAHNNGVVRGIRTDASRWPLVIITFVEGFSNEDLERCFADNARLFERGEPFSSVRDLRNVKQMPSPVQREMGRVWQQRVRDEFPPLCLGVSIVSNSSFVRGLVTAISWAVPPPVPEETFPSIWQGVDWSIQRLEDRGVSISRDLRRFAVEISDAESIIAPAR
jgi:hypothetical protein